MNIQTSRFGTLEVNAERLLSFPKGILGFPNNSKYALIQTGENSGFYWLQAVDRPELAFVVCDPRLFMPDYEILFRLMGGLDPGAERRYWIRERGTEADIGDIQEGLEQIETEVKIAIPMSHNVLTKAEEYVQ